jgi:predicted Fe-S protein YdhL (DUF1289 family)
VGICSTTYGDLVCRGCKRFAHEIVGWNGYVESQRAQVWRRLAELRDGCVERRVRVEDAQCFHGWVDNLPATLREGLTTNGCVFEVLRRYARSAPDLAQLGLAAQPAFDHLDPVAIRDAIDVEFFQRAVAHYERNFKTPVQA